MRKFWLFLSVIVAGSLLAGFLMLPRAIKSYVTDKYPWVHIGDVAPRWGLVTFHGVNVHRGDIDGHDATVYVTWDFSGVLDVEVLGGTFYFQKDATSVKEKLAEGKSLPLHGKEMSITVYATYDGASVIADLKGASFDAEKVCFDKADILTHSVVVNDGCITRDGKTLTATRVEGEVMPPFEIPEVPLKHTLVTVEGLHLDIPAKKASFTKASFPPVFEVLGESKVSLQQVDLRDLKVTHPWVSPDPVMFKHISLSLHNEGPSLGFYSLTLNDEAVIVVDPDMYSLKGENTCNEWLDSMPEPLPFAQTQAKGNFSGTLGIDVAKDPKPILKLTNKCRYKCDAEPAKSLIDALRSGGPSVEYQAYDKDDELFFRKLGPAEKDWVSLQSLPSHIAKAFITLEDPGFRGHSGLISQALENSFKDNLKLGRFFRGGSTITMQLAKNLFLRRHKTVGRKAHEAMLTAILESCLGKDEILELYLNAVEFGPDLYGLGPASRFYFHKSANRLDAEEAFYLASLLPHPRKARPPLKGGLERTRRLMRVLAERGFISDEDLPELDEDLDDVDISAGCEPN